MYEDNEQPILRRALLIIVWLVIVVTIAWATIWLAFFRHNSSTDQGGLKHQTSQQPSTTNGNKTQAPSNSGSSSGSASQGGSPTTSSGNATSQPPQTLANTGAGNVFVPFGAASVVGTVIYYVRLRKKVTQ